MVVDFQAAIGAHQDVKFTPEVEEEDEDCKVYVSNIPNKLRYQGLKNYFTKFGKVNKIYYTPGSRWAFVTYHNKAECEVAIMRINELFGMKAEFAKKKDKEEVEELIEDIPFEQTEFKEKEIAEVTPFNLPTFDCEFPPLPITEEDYSQPGLLEFDPKKEFLLTHDAFWAEKLKKKYEEKIGKTCQENGMKENSQNTSVMPKTFSLGKYKEDFKEFPLMNCSNCIKKKAAYRSIKDLYFCSAKCQRMYKDKCRKNSKELNSQTPNPEFPPNKSLVTVTATCNPRELFLRSLAPIPNANYLRLLNNVQDYGRTAQNLTEPPKVHSMVLAKWGKIFTRAFVVSHDSSTNLSSVILVEFGEIERIPWVELKELSEELSKEPKYIFRCNLKNVNALDYNFKVKTYLEHYMKFSGMADRKIVYDEFEEGTIPEITLISDDLTVSSVNEHLKLLLDRSVEDIKLDTRSLNFVDETPVWPTEDVEIIILDNSFLDKGQISVAIYVQYIEFLHQWKLMQNQCESLGEKYVPLPDGMCLVKLDEDGKWHRAICSESSKFKILRIILTDYGIMGNVSTDSSRKLPIDFDFSTPLKICKIEGLPKELTEEKVEELKTILPQNKRLIAKELLELEDSYSLTLYNL